MKAMVLALGLAAVLAATIGLSLAASPGGAQAQAAPTNVRAVDGSATGEVVVSWNGVADASFYRVGWVLMSDIPAVQADGRNWLDAFDFKDVENKGQTTQTLRGLLPGVQYAFIVGSVGQRFGVASGWSDWTYLTTAGAASCPTDTGGLPQVPSGTATPTPQPGATPAATPTPTATPPPTATPAPTQAAAANGDYDSDDDGLIEIANLAQLDAIRYDLDGDGVSAHAGYATVFPGAVSGMGCPDECSGYELVADLDFDTNGSGVADDGDDYWDHGNGWLPIGSSFNATFDGNGHVIANLYIRWTDVADIGFFRATGGLIRNLGLTSLDVAGRNRVGGLVGSNGGDIVNSYVTGRVAGSSDEVGGLVGRSGGNISNSHAVADVTGKGDYVGGLAGYAEEIIASYAAGSATGNSIVGGLAGYAEEVTASYANGSVTGAGAYVGGLAGQVREVTGSYAAGNVTGDNVVGGLVGPAGFVTGYDSNYRDCRGAIADSYAVGSVTGKGRNVGGLVGKRCATFFHVPSYYFDWYIRVTGSYWDTQTTGLYSSDGGDGVTTREMQSPAGPTGIYVNWNAEWWDFGTSRQYPALKYQGMDVAAHRQ